MIRKDPIVYLLHIQESIGILEKYLLAKSSAQFNASLELQDAVMRRLEIVGEAVKKLPLAFKKKYPLVPWRQAADMRNFLIHEYFGVNIKLVWHTVKNDLPKFRKQINEIIKENKQKVAV